MMNADDEPQLDDLNTSPTLGIVTFLINHHHRVIHYQSTTIGSFELKNKHPENKINDAFGITNGKLETEEKLSI